MKKNIYIYLAVEDELSEWVLRKILSIRSTQYVVGAVYGQRGFGYLKKQAPAFNNAAKCYPFLLLTDLDKYDCPPILIKKWLRHPQHPHFLLRVAVRTVESWLLSDMEGLTNFLSLKKPASFQKPESLLNPKDSLLGLAVQSSNRQMREALVRRDDKTGRLYQGPDYNGTLAKYVLTSWNIHKARTVSESLDRLFHALDRLETSMPNNSNLR